MDGQTAQSTTFPSDADRLRLHRLICLRGAPPKGTALPELTEEDRWCWHAYIYGFRRVQLGQFANTSPVDEQGDWYNADMAARAERYYRQKLGVRAKPSEHPTAPYDTVRPDWKRIPATELTAAEHELADPEIARLSAKAQRDIAEIVERGRRAFRDKHTHHETRAGIERPVRAATVDVPPEELLARVGGYAVKVDDA